eukprot:3122213-Pyramimonas_sp.AAC.1
MSERGRGARRRRREGGEEEDIIDELKVLGWRINAGIGVWLDIYATLLQKKPATCIAQHCI